MDELKILLGNDPFDIVAISETHCDSTITDLDISLDNFCVTRKDRSRHGGGVALYVKNNISFEVISQLDNELEVIFVKVKQKQTHPLYLGVVYRPPNSPNEFFDKLSEIIHSISENAGEIIIIGDFNCDLLPEICTPFSRALLSLMDTNLLHQLISVPTRVTPHTKSLIDHVFSSIPEEHQHTGVVKTHISDHYLIFTVFGYARAKQKNDDNIIEYRCFRHFSNDNFVIMLQNLPFNEILNDKDPNHAWQCWVDLLISAVNKHAPVKRKRIRSKLCPWITGDLIEAMNRRDWLYTMATKPSNPDSSEFWSEYKSLRNEITCMIRNAKNDYINALLHENGGTPNAMWKTLKLISSSKKESNLKLEVDGEEVIDAKKIANHFNNYFVDAVDTMFNPLNFENDVNNSTIDRASEPSVHSDTVDTVPPVNSFDLPVITDEFVMKEIERIPIKKATGPDDVSIKLLKLACNSQNVIQSLTYILHSSLDQGIFFDEWKIARVQPIYKAGSKLSVENYRPVSLLSIPSKILEKAVNTEFQEYLKVNKILTERQFGFRPNHSCETALLCMVDLWAQNVDKGNLNGVAYIDMRKAFDAVNHSTLLMKLKNVGCTDRAIKWFRSYLGGRSQFVSIKGKKSSTRTINYGVPQGSVLAPLLFSIFINDLPTSIHSADMFLFADDATMSVQGKTLSEIQTKLNLALDEVYSWTQKINFY